ncbi:MAG: PVC-type heme-binding CxxCH protein, partial [Planctomycetaceae bacterium]
PDGDPQVLLSGFGMEDTSSLANSLTWGPDGWLYGTQGTNITANIRGNIFEQGIWRYHPATKEFELYCEGGGNPWGLDFDKHGNLFYSTNHGGFVMHHGVPGAYYAKSFQKHGELHNPYAFGWFDHVPHQNFQGGHVTVGGSVYQENALPAEYRDRYIAADLLGHAVNWHQIVPHGSTFQTKHGGELLQANDTWFAPSDLTIGPDGCIYIADWHDKRTAHPDPDANWDKSNGRIFRLKPKGYQPPAPIDVNKLSNEDLIRQAVSTSAWHSRRALRVLSERHDPRMNPALVKMLSTATGDAQALQILWGLQASGGFDETLAGDLLKHKSADVRAWTVRFLAELPRLAEETRETLVSIAAKEESPHVLSELASALQRLPAFDALPIASALIGRADAKGDPYLPLQCWWGIERHSMTDPDLVLEYFATDAAWQNSLAKTELLPRLMRRYAAEGTKIGFRVCARLFHSAKNPEDRSILLEELEKGLLLIGSRNSSASGLPLGSSFARFAVEPSAEKKAAKRLQQVPAELKPILDSVWSDDGGDPLVIRLTARAGDERGVTRAMTLAGVADQNLENRLAMFSIVEELGDERAIEVALAPIANGEAEKVQSAAMSVLGRFNDSRIAAALLEAYPKFSDSLRVQARGVMFGRKDSTQQFLNAVEAGRIAPKDVPTDELRRIALHQDAELDALVRKHWGNIRAGTPEEKLAEIRRLSNDLRAEQGNLEAGHELFKKHCATCHLFFGEGNKIGPELTQANRKDLEFLLVSIVDPNAQVRKEYLNYIVVTNDGRVTTGLLAEETPASVTIVGAKNERTTIRRDDIEEIRESPVSLMPEKILEPLKPQEVRDLFRYLQK